MTIVGRFQSFNVCREVWSKRGVPGAPKIADAWGADEIRIDNRTAAAVTIRASLFMVFTRGGFASRIAVSFAEIAAIPMTSTLAPCPISCCPAGHKCNIFPGAEPEDVFGLLMVNEQQAAIGLAELRRQLA